MQPFDTKIRRFQYKLLNNIVQFVRMTKLLDLKWLIHHFTPFVKQRLSPLSTYFSTAMQQEHFGSCFLLGLSNKRYFKSSHILAKFYIQECKLNIIHPSLNVFIAKIRATCSKIELIRITDRFKLGKHYRKWNKVLPVCYPVISWLVLVLHSPCFFFFSYIY